MPRTDSLKHVIDEIVEFHRIGTASLTARPQKGGYGSRVIEEEAERNGLNPDAMRKARAFAAEATGYNGDELKQLLKAIRENVDAFQERGRAFGRSYIFRLLSVPKAKGERRKMQAELFANAWSVDELDVAIKARFGNRRQGGRRRRIATGLQGLLAQLDGLCGSWIRLFEELERRTNEVGELSLEDLQSEVRGPVDRATRAIRIAQKSILTAYSPNDIRLQVTK